VRKQPTGLDDVADPATQFVPVDVGDILVTEHDATLGRLDEPIDHLERRGLAAPGRTDEHDNFSGRDLEGDAVHGRVLLASVAFGDPLEQDRLAANYGRGDAGRNRGCFSDGGFRHGYPWV